MVRFIPSQNVGWISVTHPPQQVDFGGCALAYPPYALGLANIIKKAEND